MGNVDMVNVEKTQYPIYKQSKTTGVVVKFRGMSIGEVINSGITDYDVGKIYDTWIPHTYHGWRDWTPLETKTVYEWMWKDVDGCWHVSDRLREVQEASSFYGKYKYKKTGRSWEVEV